MALDSDSWRWCSERRTEEIGVRLALGASHRQVSGLLLREVAIILAVGLPLGGPSTPELGQWLRAMLFGLTPLTIRRCCSRRRPCGRSRKADNISDAPRSHLRPSPASAQSRFRRRRNPDPG